MIRCAALSAALYVHHAEGLAGVISADVWGSTESVGWRFDSLGYSTGAVTVYSVSIQKPNSTTRQAHSLERGRAAAILLPALAAKWRFLEIPAKKMDNFFSCELRF